MLENASVNNSIFLSKTEDYSTFVSITDIKKNKNRSRPDVVNHVVMERACNWCVKIRKSATRQNLSCLLYQSKLRGTDK